MHQLLHLKYLFLSYSEIEVHKLEKGFLLQLGGDLMLNKVLETLMINSHSELLPPTNMISIFPWLVKHIYILSHTEREFVFRDQIIINIKFGCPSYIITTPKPTSLAPVSITKWFVIVWNSQHRSMNEVFVSECQRLVELMGSTKI